MGKMMPMVADGLKEGGHGERRPTAMVDQADEDGARAGGWVEEMWELTIFGEQQAAAGGGLEVGGGCEGRRKRGKEGWIWWLQVNGWRGWGEGGARWPWVMAGGFSGAEFWLRHGGDGGLDLSGEPEVVEVQATGGAAMEILPVMGGAGDINGGGKLRKMAIMATGKGEGCVGDGILFEEEGSSSRGILPVSQCGWWRRRGGREAAAMVGPRGGVHGGKKAGGHGDGGGFRRQRGTAAAVVAGASMDGLLACRLWMAVLQAAVGGRRWWHRRHDEGRHGVVCAGP